MKQFIVMISLICLGLFLYAWIAGEEDSVMSGLRAVWDKSLSESPYAVNVT